MQKEELKQGIHDSIPIVLGYLPLGVAFGVLANEVIQATMMSALCFTGAGQYIAIGIMQAGRAEFTIILANVLVNLRYSLFSTSLVPTSSGEFQLRLVARYVCLKVFDHSTGILVALIGNQDTSLPCLFCHSREGTVLFPKHIKTEEILHFLCLL